jgi:thiamine-phosphate pyrophosphorylase
MSRGQTKIPRQWLIVDERNLGAISDGIRRLPPSAGVLVLLRDRPPAERQRLLRKVRVAAGTKGLTVADEASGVASRVHNGRELRRALLARTPLILLSPIHQTQSHPDWTPLPRMRAAALARLARKRLIALGGMNGRRFPKIAPLGFQAWAGIDGWGRP